MKRLVLIMLALLVSVEASAHRFAPSLLRLFEVGDGQYQVIWKTPAQRISEIPLQPVFPEACSGAPAESTREGTGVLVSFRLSCPGVLIGEEIAVTGSISPWAARCTETKVPSTSTDTFELNN